MYFLIALVAAGFGAIKAPPERTYVNSPQMNVVLVLMEAGKCSGSVVGKDLVLTAAHCVEKLGEEVQVVFENSVSEKFVTVYIGEPGSRNDVALLSGKTHGVKPLAVSEEPLDLPGSCMFYGYAGTKVQMLMPCFLIEDVGPMGIRGVAEAFPGDSGGPVIGRDGALIGVTWGGLSATMLYFVAPAESVLKAIRSLNAPVIEAAQPSAPSAPAP